MEQQRYIPFDDDILREIYPVFWECAQKDQIAKPLTLEEFRSIMIHTPFGPNVRLWRDPLGKIGGFGTVTGAVRNGKLYIHIEIKVLPAFRSEGLEYEILQWAKQIISKAKNQKGISAICHLVVARNHQSLRNLLEVEGFVLQRTFLIVNRQVQKEHTIATSPAGVNLREVQGMSDEQLWMTVYNEGYAQNWGIRPYSHFEYEQRFSKPQYFPTLDLLAFASDGDVAGFCTATLDLTDRRNGWIAGIAVRPQYRRLKIGQMLLDTIFQRLKEMGCTNISLDVDAENEPFVGLIGSCGFRLQNSYFFYQHNSLC